MSPIILSLPEDLSLRIEPDQEFREQVILMLARIKVDLGREAIVLLDDEDGTELSQLELEAMPRG